MKINTQDYNDVTVVTLQGELDSDAVESLRNTMTGLVTPKNEKSSTDGSFLPVQSKIGIVIDMTNVNFIDGVGLEFLLWIRDYCNDNHCQLRLAGLNEICSKILEITRLENEFTCYAELTGAVKSFA